MACTLHPSPQGAVGVCASCLRQKLLSLIEAGDGEDRRKSDTEPPPIIFPRSVSPYICRSSAASHHRLFYSTPQVGPATFERKKGKKSGFSLLASLFGGSKSEEIEKDPRNSTAPMASSSWFAAFRKKKSRLFSVDDEITTRDREVSGMREEEHWSEWSPGWRKSVSGTSVPVPAPTRRGSQHGGNVSGLGICWSPLVRASPRRHESGLWLDLRSGSRHHLGNGSRKVSDFGRYTWSF